MRLRCGKVYRLDSVAAGLLHLENAVRIGPKATIGSESYSSLLQNPLTGNLPNAKRNITEFPSQNFRFALYEWIV